MMSQVTVEIRHVTASDNYTETVAADKQAQQCVDVTHHIHKIHLLTSIMSLIITYLNASLQLNQTEAKI